MFSLKSFSCLIRRPLVSLCFCACRRCVMVSLTSPPPWPLTPCRRSWPSAPGRAAYGCILQTFPPTPPSSPPSLPPFPWRPCSDARTLSAAFEPFLHQKLKSGSKFPPAHQPVALLQFISRSHPTPRLHPPPFHPSCCTVTPPSWVFMSWTHN